jgi:hypothetical protein
MKGEGRGKTELLANPARKSLSPSESKRLNIDPL